MEIKSSNTQQHVAFSHKFLTNNILERRRFVTGNEHIVKTDHHKTTISSLQLIEISFTQVSSN
jgi:hypothetical protein